MKIRDNNLYEEIQKAMHFRWDPIGISSYSEEVGEYNGYAPALYKLLSEGANQKKIFEYLWKVELESLGLTGNKQATEEFSFWLCELSKSKRVTSCPK